MVNRSSKTKKPRDLNKLAKAIADQTTGDAPPEPDPNEGKNPHAVALHFAHYNFCRIHQSLKVTPAMEASVTGKLWTIEDLLTKISN